MRIATITKHQFSNIAIDMAKVEEIEFRSGATFLDYDILIINLNVILGEYVFREKRISNIEDVPLINQEIFNTIHEDIKRREFEIRYMLELGRSVIVFVPQPEVFSISGAKAQLYNLLDYFSIFNLETSRVRGRNIEVKAEEPFRSFWETTKDFLMYYGYLNQPIGTPLFYIKGTQLVVGSYSKVGDGNLILVPSFASVEEYHINENIKRNYILAVITLVKALGSKKLSEDVILPEFSKNYNLPDELRQREELIGLEEELEILQKKIEGKKDLISEIEKKKLLFAGSGKLLEIEVQKVFEALGFTILEALPNRDDLILKYNENIAVVEVKGVSKSAAEKHAAQLEKWVSEYHANHDIKPKGILVVNPFCDLPLKDRKEVAFPSQMIPYSTAREHCLITGLQLLGLYFDCKENDEKKAEMVELIFATNGVFSKYRNWEFFIKVEEEDVKTLTS